MLPETFGGNKMALPHLNEKTTKGSMNLKKTKSGMG